MSEHQRVGEPADQRRPAGAPETEAQPAGMPPEEAPERAEQAPEPADGAREASDEARAEVEADLDAMLAETQRERDEYLELARRARADFENYRKRAAREASNAERRGRSALARELVPALDNLERALRAAGVDPDADIDEDESDGGGLEHGVRLVLREMRATLARAGVEAYDPTGERFDPTFHEALATRASDGTESGIVLETVEKGYRLDGQVLRAARVIVSE
jgi:molecular chaperone GrpE